MCNSWRVVSAFLLGILATVSFYAHLEWLVGVFCLVALPWRPILRIAGELYNFLVTETAREQVESEITQLHLTNSQSRLVG